MEAFGQGRAGIPAFRQFGDRGAGDYIKMEEMLMKKEAGFFLAMMCVLTLVGCGTSNNAEKQRTKFHSLLWKKAWHQRNQCCVSVR